MEKEGKEGHRKEEKTQRRTEIRDRRSEEKREG